MKKDNERLAKLREVEEEIIKIRYRLGDLLSIHDRELHLEAVSSKELVKKYGEFIQRKEAEQNQFALGYIPIIVECSEYRVEGKHCMYVRYKEMQLCDETVTTDRDYHILMYRLEEAKGKVIELKKPVSKKAS